MSRIILIILIPFVLFAVGCSKTTVVLLPDDDGNVGEVYINTENGNTTLNQENQIATSSTSKDDAPKFASKEELEKDTSIIEKIMPEKSISFMLHFIFNSDELTEESAALIPEILDAIKKREPCEVSIIGHTDTLGSDEYNITLSTQRAESIKALLLKKGGNISNMQVSSHGENDPIIKTKDNVSEPRNRRVEVMVR